MESELLTVLKGKNEKGEPLKDTDWWESKISVGDKLFKLLKSSIKNDSTKWEEIEEQIIEWKDSLESYNISELINQWHQAAKLFVVARYLSTQSKSKDSFVWGSEHLSEIRNLINDNKHFQELNQEFKEEEKEKNLIQELQLLFSLFSENSNENERWIEIPLVAARNNKVAKPNTSKKIGKVFILILRRTDSFGEISQNPTFVIKQPPKKNFTDSIKSAYKFNKLFWENCQRESLDTKWKETNNDKEVASFGFLWDIKADQIEAGGDDDKEGESAGLAATVGIFHALINQIPDNRIVYSVKLGIDCDNQPTGKFEPVNDKSIPAKITAALDTNFIDTFVMHKDNFNENNKNKELENLIEGKNFRIKTINSEGNFVKTYPKIRETPVKNGAS